VVLEDPRDKRLLEAETRKQWNQMNRVNGGGGKKKKEEKADHEYDDSQLNKYSDALVSEV